MQRLFDAATERREEQRSLEPLLIHDRDSRVAVAVLGAERLDLHERAGVDALGDLAAEQRVEASGHDDRVERRVRHEAVDAAAHQQLDALAVERRDGRPAS